MANNKHVNAIIVGAGAGGGTAAGGGAVAVGALGAATSTLGWPVPGHAKAAGGRVVVAEIDAHRVHAIDAASGEVLWQFTAGGRVDSPPISMISAPSCSICSACSSACTAD